jgi:hypothetical protein
MNQHSVTKNPINLSRNVGIRAEDPFAKVQSQNRNVVGKRWLAWRDRVMVGLCLTCQNSRKHRMKGQPHPML